MKRHDRGDKVWVVRSFRDIPLPKQPVARILVIAFGLLVVVGFVLGMAMDAGVVVDTTPLLHLLKLLPRALRVVIYVVMGVPIGLGLVLYVVLELAGMFDFVTSPFRRN